MSPQIRRLTRLVSVLRAENPGPMTLEGTNSLLLRAPGSDGVVVVDPGPDLPEHLREAGELRLAHKQASLEELGQLADPPLTKDAIAGRIRRLLSTADKAADSSGVPNTEASLPADLREDD